MSISEKAFRFFMYLAFGCLALGIFGSTSLLGVYITSLGIACSIYYCRFPKKLLTPPKSSIPLLIIIIIGLVSFILNFNETDKPYIMLKKLKYFLAASLAILPIQYFFSKLSTKTIQRFSKIFIASIALAAIYGFFGAINDNQIGDYVFEGIGKRSGGLTDIMRFSYGLALIFPLSLILLIKKPSEYLPSKRWIITLVILIVFGVITAQSRGAFFGLTIALPICLFFKSRKMAIIIFAAIISTMSLYIYQVEKAKHPSAQSRFFQKIKSRSNLLRLSQFEAAYYAIKEKPLFGHGMSRFKPQVERIKNQYDLPYKKFINQHSHNVFLEMAAQLGIIGLVAFLSWFVLWGVDSHKNNRLAYYLPFVAIFFTIGQFEQLFLTNNMILTFSVYQLSLLKFQPHDG